MLSGFFGPLSAISWALALALSVDSEIPQLSYSTQIFNPRWGIQIFFVLFFLPPVHLKL